jgi:hypothetical protein
MHSVALIGSFKQHLNEIWKVREFFVGRGIEVITPTGQEVEDPEEDFVRFRKEFEEHDNQTIQTITMHRILLADATYVVDVKGYVGNTTSYEIGRIVQACRPLYFSEAPDDLPLLVPKKNIVSQEQLAEMILAADRRLSALHAEGDDLCSTLERQLLNGELVRM